MWARFCPAKIAAWLARRSTFPFLAYVQMYWADLRDIVRGAARAEGPSVTLPHECQRQVSGHLVAESVREHWGRWCKVAVSARRGHRSLKGWRSVISGTTLSACLCGVVMALALLVLWVRTLGPARCLLSKQIYPLQLDAGIAAWISDTKC